LADFAIDGIRRPRILNFAKQIHMGTEKRRPFVGAVRDYPLEAYYSRLAGNYVPRNETQEHGIIEFDDGRLGIFHWTSVAYDSPVR
jgi:hypothetical protein